VRNCSLIGNQISQWWRKQVTQSSRYVGRKQTDRVHEIARCRRTKHEIWISLILQRPSISRTSRLAALENIGRVQVRFL